MEINNRIKELRTDKGYTLAQLAEMTGYTASFLSQIERGIKSPSLEALRKIADCLGVPIMTFMIDYDDSYLIRSSSRKKTIMPDINTVYEFITPTISNENMKPNMVGMIVKIKPNAWVSEKMVTHSAQESIFVTKGSVEVHLSNSVNLLNTGDSFYIREGVPHNILNPGDDEAVVLGYLSPAIY